MKIAYMDLSNKNWSVLFSPLTSCFTISVIFQYNNFSTYFQNIHTIEIQYTFCFVYIQFKYIQDVW